MWAASFAAHNQLYLARPRNPPSDHVVTISILSYSSSRCVGTVGASPYTVEYTRGLEHVTSDADNERPSRTTGAERHARGSAGSSCSAWRPPVWTSTTRGSWRSPRSGRSLRGRRRRPAARPRRPIPPEAVVRGPTDKAGQTLMVFSTRASAKRVYHGRGYSPPVNWAGCGSLTSGPRCGRTGTAGSPAR